jgi:hypothetical protein
VAKRPPPFFGSAGAGVEAMLVGCSWAASCWAASSGAALPKAVVERAAAVEDGWVSSRGGMRWVRAGAQEKEARIDEVS